MSKAKRRWPMTNAEADRIHFWYWRTAGNNGRPTYDGANWARGYRAFFKWKKSIDEIAAALANPFAPGAADVLFDQFDDIGYGEDRYHELADHVTAIAARISKRPTARQEEQLDVRVGRPPTARRKTRRR